MQAYGICLDYVEVEELKLMKAEETHGELLCKASREATLLEKKHRGDAFSKKNEGSEKRG